MKIKIQDLKENPGILPFKLGTSKLKIASHTFLYYHNIPPIINQMNTLNKVHKNIKNIIDLSPLSFKEPLQNFYNHLDYEIITLNQKVQLFHLSKRNKRGLLNPLGSIIKFITGNLDNEDSLQIRNSLEKIETSQTNVIKKVNRQLSITQNLMVNINQTMSTIIKNQNTISQKLLELQEAINKVTFEFIHFLEIKDILSQLKLNLDSLLHFVTEIENAITFAKLGIAHPSIISLENLYKINLELSNLYNNDQLLIIKEDYLRSYYNIIKTNVYFFDDKIIFSLDFPLVNSKTFQYYRLFSIPTKNKTVLLPPSSYISLSDTEYQYHNEECTKLEHNYFCEANNLQSTQENDCITSLLSVQGEPKYCEYVPVQTNRDFIEEINEGHYIGIFPKKEKVQTNCEQTNIAVLQGTFLFTVPPGCSLQTTHYKYINKKGSLIGNPLILENIKLANISIKPVGNLNIEKVSLSKLHEIQLQTLQETPIEEIAAHKEILRWSSTTFILLIILFLAILITTKRKLLSKVLKTRKNTCHPLELKPLDETEVLPP